MSECSPPNLFAVSPDWRVLNELEAKLVDVLVPNFPLTVINEHAKSALKTLVNSLELKPTANSVDICQALELAPLRRIQIAIESLIASCSASASEQKLQDWFYGAICSHD
jgi:hypothetical protein